MSSFYTSLSGLRAAQTNLSVISNNIANVSTIGFKKSRADFGDMVSSSLFQVSGSPGLGTRMMSLQQQFTQGGVESTDRSLDLMISGGGFFVTKSNGGTGQTNFTRAGAFGTTPDGYVTDANGGYLQVLPVDSSGNVTATGMASMQNLQIQQSTGTATASTALNLGVSLPADAELPANRSVYNETNPYAFDRNDPNSYNSSSSTTVYDSVGNPVQATVYYVRAASPDETNPGSEWKAYVFVGDKAASADGQATDPAVPVTLSFDASGALTAPTAGTQLGSVLPSGAAAPLALSIDFNNGTTQQATSFAVTTNTQDGKAPGTLNNLDIGNDGLVTASYSDGTIMKLGRVALATFPNPEGLRALGDSSWAITNNSGAPTVGAADGSALGAIQSGALEQANVDITEELVALIAAQRNFQANAKAIDTASQMTEAAVNLRT